MDKKVAVIEKPLLGIGLVLVFLLFLLAIFGPQLAPNDPNQVDLTGIFAEPSPDYPLGKDQLGRCLLSRLLWAVHISLGASLLLVGGVMLTGLVVGSVAGYLGGWTDRIIIGIIDVLLAFPGIILALVIAGILGPGINNVILAIWAVHWAWYGRVVRGMVLSLRSRQFVLAARVLGTKPYKIIYNHILPHILGPVLILATLDVSKMILTIAGLSFLGLGASPTTPEWGAMLNDARPYFLDHPRVMIWPGLAVMVAGLSFQLLGEGLRDQMDTTNRQSIMKEFFEGR